MVDAGLDADVVVVGAGIAGLCAAWQLSTARYDCIVIDRFEAGHHRGGSHTGVRIFRLNDDQPERAEAARQALPLWRQLEDEAGASLLDQVGALDHLPPDQMQQVERVLRTAGVPYELLDVGAATERWPWLRPRHRVLWQPDGGRLWSDRVRDALRRVATAAGTRFRDGETVETIRQEPSRCTVTTAEARFRCRSVVIAAGPWTPQLAPAASDFPALRAHTAQPIYLPVADTDLEPWPSFRYRWRPDDDDGVAIYGAGEPGTGLRVGTAGREPERDPDLPPPEHDEEQLATVRRMSQSAFALGDDAGWQPSRTCTYSTTPDDRHRVERRDRIVVAAGFCGAGFKFAPAIGRQVRELVEAATAASQS